MSSISEHAVCICGVLRIANFLQHIQILSDGLDEVGETLQTRTAAALAGGARPGRRASASTRSASARGYGPGNRRSEVELHTHLGVHVAEHGVAVERLDLAVA